MKYYSFEILPVTEKVIIKLYIFQVCFPLFLTMSSFHFGMY
jgi:hypothetical protein